MKLYHGGLPENTELKDIDLFRISSKQNKHHNDYAGFYLSENSAIKTASENSIDNRTHVITGLFIDALYEASGGKHFEYKGEPKEYCKKAGIQTADQLNSIWKNMSSHFNLSEDIKKELTEKYTLNTIVSLGVTLKHVYDTIKDSDLFKKCIEEFDKVVNQKTKAESTPDNTNNQTGSTQPVNTDDQKSDDDKVSEIISQKNSQPNNEEDKNKIINFLKTHKLF